MKVLCGIQARTNSSRLPRKIYETIGDKSLLQWVYQASYDANLSLPKEIELIVAVLPPKGDEELLKYCKESNLNVIETEAEENDLVSRYHEALEKSGCDALIRLTADCWALPKGIIMGVAKCLLTNDYASNTIERSFPEGFDAQGCSKKAMSWFNENQKESREHPFCEFDANASLRKKFSEEGMSITMFCDETNPIFYHTSIDTSADLERARKFYEANKAKLRMEAEKPS